MSARFLIRLDDACPEMNHARWSPVEALFDRLNIKPIVAIVPDNQDPELRHGPTDPGFWARACGWQAKGWAIAQHGWQHRLHTTRARQYLSFHSRSEFVGLTIGEQSALVRQGWAALRARGLTPTVWVAPAHSFDRTTLDAVAQETSIRIISDGIARDQYFADGFHWFPQQLWSPVPKPNGLWTVCLHPNTMGTADIDRLERLLSGPFAGKILAVSDVALSRRPRGLGDRLEVGRFWARHHLYRSLTRVRSLAGRQ